MDEVTVKVEAPSDSAPRAEEQSSSAAEVVAAAGAAAAAASSEVGMELGQLRAILATFQPQMQELLSKVDDVASKVEGLTTFQAEVQRTLQTCGEILTEYAADEEGHEEMSGGTETVTEIETPPEQPPEQVNLTANRGLLSRILLGR